MSPVVPLSMSPYQLFLINALLDFSSHIYYCSEQVSQALPAEEGCGETTGGCGEETTGGCDYVYLWEDWVTVFYRHMERTMDNGLPLNTR